MSYRPGCSLEELLGSDQQPAVLKGAMSPEEWPALQWKPDELLQQSGDVEVPVEVSRGGGDYRELYSPRPTDSSRAFEAGVPVPLSVLLQHMQEADQQQVSPMHGIFVMPECYISRK